MYKVNLTPDRDQYVIIAHSSTNNTLETVGGIYTIKANALKECARRNADALANYETYKEKDPRLAAFCKGMNYTVARIKYETVTE